jgi:hypothetical protein
VLPILVVGDENELRQIVRQCGHHALTIALAGAYITQIGDVSPATLQVPRVAFRLDVPVADFDHAGFTEALQAATGMPAEKFNIVRVREGSAIVEVEGDGFVVSGILVRLFESPECVRFLGTKAG